MSTNTARAAFIAYSTATDTYLTGAWTREQFRNKVAEIEARYGYTIMQACMAA